MLSNKVLLDVAHLQTRVVLTHVPHHHQPPAVPERVLPLTEVRIEVPANSLSGVYGRRVYLHRYEEVFSPHVRDE
jgi:hypothetical protein